MKVMGGWGEGSNWESSVKIQPLIPKDWCSIMHKAAAVLGQEVFDQPTSSFVCYTVCIIMNIHKLSYLEKFILFFVFAV